MNSAPARKHTGEGSTVALKPRVDVARSPKQEYQYGPTKRTCVLQKVILTRKSSCVNARGVPQVLHLLSQTGGVPVLRYPILTWLGGTPRNDMRPVKILWDGDGQTNKLKLLPFLILWMQAVKKKR